MRRLCIYLLFINLFPNLFGEIIWERLLSINGVSYTKEQAQEAIKRRKIPQINSEGSWDFGYANEWRRREIPIIPSNATSSILARMMWDNRIKLKSLDLLWADVPKQFEILEESMVKEEGNWIRNLPSFDIVSKRAKSAANENEKLVVMKSLHIWQSFEDSVVAVKEISHEKVIKLSSVYPLSRNSEYSFTKPTRIIVQAGKGHLLAVNNWNYVTVNSFNKTCIESGRVDKIYAFPLGYMSNYKWLFPGRKPKNADFVIQDKENSVDTILWTMHGVKELFPLTKSIKIDSFRELMEKKYGIEFKSPNPNLITASSHNSSVISTNSDIILIKSYKNTRFDPEVIKNKTELKTNKDILDAFD